MTAVPRVVPQGGVSGYHWHDERREECGFSGADLIEVEASERILASREAVWRHLTRVSDWPRWYPGLHGVHATDAITSAGYQWRSSGQMGRLLYRSDNAVTDYRMLERIEIRSDRRPWISTMQRRLMVSPDGANCHVTIQIEAEPGLSVAGRVLAGTLRRRLADEAEQIGRRLKDYVEHTLPHH